MTCISWHCNILFLFRFQLLFLTLASTLVAGALSSSILFPNFFHCLMAVARGEMYEPNLNALDDTTLSIESQVILGFIWIGGTLFSLLLLVFRQGGLHIKDLFRGQSRPSTTPSTPKKKITAMPSSMTTPPPLYMLNLIFKETFAIV